jgi:transcription elongation factor
MCCPKVIATQRLRKNVTVEKNKQTKTDNLLEAWFSMRLTPYKGKLGIIRVEAG